MLSNKVGARYADLADLRRTADRLEHRNRCYWSLARAAIEGGRP
jgi:hypothetical protein